MKDLVDYILKSLVSKPDEVVIDESSDENGIQFKVNIHPDDMGMVIGKSGQTIKAIRRLLTARAMAENSHQRVYLNLNESNS